MPSMHIVLFPVLITQIFVEFPLFLHCQLFHISGLIFYIGLSRLILLLSITDFLNLKLANGITSLKGEELIISGI